MTDQPMSREHVPSRCAHDVGSHRGSPDERERQFLAEGFGARLRSLRLAAGLTQAQLAARAKCTRETVSLLENGRRRPEVRMVRLLLRHLVPSERRALERKLLNRLADTSWREHERRTGRRQVATRADAEAFVARELARGERLRARIAQRTI